MTVEEEFLEDRQQLIARPKQKCNMAKIKQRLEERRAREEDMKAEEEKLKPTFNNLIIRMINHTFWPEVEKNRKNLEDASLWDFLLIPLEP